MNINLAKSLKNISSRLFPDLRQNNWLVLFFLSLLVGLYLLFCIVAFFLPGGFIEQEETNTFILGWFLAPTFAILSIPFFLWVRQKFFSQMSNGLLVLLSLNSLLFAFIITIINLSWQFFRSYDITANLAFISILVIPVTNLIAILILKSIKNNPGWTASWIPSILGGLGLVNFIGLYPYLNNDYSIPFPIFIISATAGAAAGILSLFIKGPKNPFSNKRGWTYLIDALVIVVVIITCIDPSLTFDAHHENFYLGPVNRILHGGTMLVDTYSQYGVLIIYFLTLVFKSRILPLTYQGLALLIAALYIGQYLIVYFLLVRLLKNRLYAIFFVILALLLGFFGTLGIAQAYPSIGPLRFGLVYVLFTVIFLRRRFSAFNHMGLWIEYALVGLAFLWSFETFIYLSFPYLGICLYESFSESIPLRSSIRRFLSRLGWFFLSIATANLIFALATYARAETWPNWSIYLDFIKTYSSLGGFGDLPIDTWSPWIFSIIIYFTSLMIFAFRYFYLKTRGNSTEEVLVLGLTLFGIAQYTYYLGRSHPNSLFHIAIPAILVLGYWFIKFQKKIEFPLSLRTAGKIVFFSAAVLVILGIWPTFFDKYNNLNTGLSLFKNMTPAALNTGNIRNWLTSENKLLHSGSGNRLIVEARSLISKYMPSQKEIPVFLSYRITTEVLFATNHIHSFPMSDVVEDSISDKNVQRILEYPDPLKTGDVVFLEKDPLSYQDKDLYHLEVLLIDKLCQEYNLENIESTYHNIQVVRLKPHDNRSSTYSETIKSLK